MASRFSAATSQTPRAGPAPGSILLAKQMKYRDVEFMVVQDLGRELWKWSTSPKGIAIQGQAATKVEATLGER